MYAHGARLLGDAADRLRNVFTGNHDKVGIFVDNYHDIRQETVPLFGIEPALRKTLVIFFEVLDTGVAEQHIAVVHLHAKAVEGGDYLLRVGDDSLGLVGQFGEILLVDGLKQRELYRLRVDENKFQLVGILCYRADGLLFSTPTGSTAYALSAGGPVIDPALSLIELTPVCPHSLTARTVLFTDDTVLEVKSKNRDTAYLTVDGQISVPLDPTDKVKIYRSEYTLSMITMKEKNFYKLAGEKLKEGN